MEQLIQSLQAIGFTGLEAQIYLALLEGGEMSPYHLAKKIQITRPSIYNALEHMYEKGYVDVIADDTVLYQAQNPKVLLEKMNAQFQKNQTYLCNGLEEFVKTSKKEIHSNFKGFETMVAKAKEILREAKQDVYINADFPLDLFYEEFWMLKKQNIRVIVFSFCKLDLKDMPVELFCHERDIKEPSRLMIVVHDTIAMIADQNKSRGTWQGTVSNNSLMVSVISEHIHNDIYLLRMREKFGTDANLYKDAFLHSAFEKKEY